MRALTLAVFTVLAAGCGGGTPSDREPAGRESTAAEGGSSAVAPDVRADGAGKLRVPTEGWKTDFSKHTVPLDEFWSVVPVKDGIPPIDEPRFVSVEEADEWLEAREPVIEIQVGDAARAYPLQILIWHEIVNDEIGGIPVVVTFCPLCYTALAFERTVDGHVLDFGTTGNLRHSDLVMYDRQTETWWQQFGGEAVVGELARKELVRVPAAIVAWDDFASRHPDGLVLSRDTGYDKYYGVNPYGGYDRVDRPPMFPAGGEDDRLLPKERVVLLERDEETVAVPFSALAEKNRIEVEVGGETVEVLWLGGVRSSLGDPSIARAEEGGGADVRSLETGERVPFDTPFWFAVAAFRPDARIVTR